MKKHNFNTLLDKYHHRSCTSEEKLLVEEYLDSFQNLREEVIVDELEIKQRIYARIETAINDKKQNQKLNKSNKILSVVAAVIISIIGVGVLFQLLTKETIYTEEAALGERKILELSDGSKVFLNSGSTLKYTSNFNQLNREVYLSGEAFFEVTRNELKPFIVKTSHLQTRVLGTSFNINSYKDNTETKVSVATGKVEVSGSVNTNQYLLKNEQLVYNTLTSTYKKEYYESSNDVLWKDNVILFNDITLDDAVKKLEKWFNVVIKIEDEELKSEYITGKFNNPSILEVLESLQFSLQFFFEYDEEQKLILIKNQTNKNEEINKKEKAFSAGTEKA